MREWEIDWNQVWKDGMNGCEAAHAGLECADLWRDRKTAERYWEVYRTSTTERLERLQHGPDSHVLDIGSGPGVLAIPLAQKVARVSAVEPSPGMMAVMKEKALERGLTNIDYVEKRWDDVDVITDLKNGSYDIVFASFSLQMFDIRRCIEKMEQVSSRYVHLFWFAGTPTWFEQHAALWPKLHNREYQEPPMSDVLFNVLYQMGIYPQVSSYLSHFTEEFALLDDAIAHYGPMVGAITDDQKTILEGFLRDTLEPANGGFAMRDRFWCMHIWWEKEDNR